MTFEEAKIFFEKQRRIWMNEGKSYIVDIGTCVTGNIINVFMNNSCIDICINEYNLGKNKHTKPRIEYCFYIKDVLTGNYYHSTYRKCNLENITENNLIDLINNIYQMRNK